MKRFYFGSEDDGGEEEESDAEAFGMPSASEFIAMAGSESPFRHLMDCSIRICEKNFVWRFLSHEDKIAMIRSVFEGLSNIEKEYEGDADIRDEM
jgi:hypothetical protein